MRASAAVFLGAFLTLARLGLGEAASYEHDCPLCDSSVYSYCSRKLLHDACCCLDPRGIAFFSRSKDPSLPYQCKYADCSFLHANSCREHRLITRCCCDRLLRL